MAQDGKRAYPRFAVDAEVTLRFADASVTGRTTNVSRGGLQVELPRAIAGGTHVTIALVLVFDDAGTSEPLELPARVVWSTAIGAQHQIGCQFLPLGPRDASFVEMFLRFLGNRAPDDDETLDDDVDQDPFA